jgi:hypothetical protein
VARAIAGLPLGIGECAFAFRLASSRHAGSLLVNFVT